MAAGNAPSGEDAANWRGGYLPYYGGSWRRARRQARERDGCCQDCGMTPSDLGRALDVHHLVPFKTFGVERHREANDLANLVTLCPTCHIRREWETNWRRE
jgi:5-methylcytosine-specific restriction endonuclease McrA